MPKVAPSIEFEKFNHRIVCGLLRLGIFPAADSRGNMTGEAILGRLIRPVQWPLSLLNGRAIMIASNGRTINETAYRTLKSELDRTYPHGHFAAIHGGRIVADDATLSGLLAALGSVGVDAKSPAMAQPS
jgi:hypothetical protein